MDLADEARRRGRGLRILVTRLRFLGDIIISTAAVRVLRDRYPGSTIYYMADAGYADILEENPDIEGIIRLERGRKGFIRALKTLRSLDITAAIDLFYNPTSANLLFLSGIPVRIGGSRRWRRRLYTDVVEVPSGVRSAVDHHIYVMRSAGCGNGEAMPAVYLSEAELAGGARTLNRLLGVPHEGARTVAMHPGGTWQSKRWPGRYFSELAGMIRTRPGEPKVVVLTGPGEEGISAAVVEGHGDGVRALPTLPLRDTAAVLASCDAMVSNDGGMMHLAVALGIPTVGIFGPTEKDIWFPYEGRGPFALASLERECSPCHLHECDSRECLEDLGPGKVLGLLGKVSGL